MSKGGKFFLGTVFGATIAGVSALLFAPKSGEAFREDLKNELEDLKLRADEYKELARERGAELYDTATEKSEDIKVNLKYSADNLKQQFGELANEAKSDFSHLKDEVTKSTSKLAEEGKALYDETKNEAVATSEIVKEEVNNLKEDL